MSDRFDNKQALTEGWILMPDGGGSFEIQSDDFFEKDNGRPSPFGSMPEDPPKAHAVCDAKALAFVQQKAREGSAYHIDALARTQLL